MFLLVCPLSFCFLRHWCSVSVRNTFRSRTCIPRCTTTTTPLHHHIHCVLVSQRSRTRGRVVQTAPAPSPPVLMNRANPSRHAHDGIGVLRSVRQSWNTSYVPFRPVDVEIGSASPFKLFAICEMHVTQYHPQSRAAHSRFRAVDVTSIVHSASPNVGSTCCDAVAANIRCQLPDRYLCSFDSLGKAVVRQRPRQLDESFQHNAPDRCKRVLTDRSELAPGILGCGSGCPTSLALCSATCTCPVHVQPEKMALPALECIMCWLFTFVSYIFAHSQHSSFRVVRNATMCSPARPGRKTKKSLLSEWLGPHLTDTPDIWWQFYARPCSQAVSLNLSFSLQERSMLACRSSTPLFAVVFARLHPHFSSPVSTPAEQTEALSRDKPGQLFFQFWLGDTVNVKRFDDTFSHSKSFEPEDCMRTFSQSESTRLLSKLQGTKSQSEATGFRSIPTSFPSTHVQSRAMSHVAQYRLNTYHTG